MRAVIQRVSRAKVEVDNETVSVIENGLVVLLGVEEADSKEDIDWLAAKVLKMRIFGDDEGKMNLSVCDVGGEVIVVSQFTLHASTKKGNRPSFIKAARPELAEELYEGFIQKLKNLENIEVGSGKFGAMMEIELVNSGPVTIIIDTKNKE